MTTNTAFLRSSKNVSSVKNIGVHRKRKYGKYKTMHRPRRCGSCNHLGHNTRTCGVNKDPNWQEDVVITNEESGGNKTIHRNHRCGSCNHLGHNIRTCGVNKDPVLKAKVVITNRKCGKCGEMGHNTRTCTMKKSSRKRRGLMGIMDQHRSNIHLEISKFDNYFTYKNNTYCKMSKIRTVLESSTISQLGGTGHGLFAKRDFLKGELVTRMDEPRLYLIRHPIIKLIPIWFYFTLSNNIVITCQKFLNSDTNEGNVNEMNNNWFKINSATSYANLDAVYSVLLNNVIFVAKTNIPKDTELTFNYTGLKIR